MEKLLVIFMEATAGVPQEAAQEQGMGNFWLIMILMFAGMWFLMIAPQRKKQKEMKKMLESLGSGDDVMTIGGIYGTITNKTDKTFILKIADGVKIEIARSAIQGRVENNITVEDKK